MLIGLDFDNTIAIYDEIFCKAAIKNGLVPSNYKGRKRDIRNSLRARAGGEQQWRQIQAYVYGAAMKNAKLHPGCKAFLERCRLEEVEVHIISHKTKFSPHDPQRVDMQKMAWSWMDDLGFFDQSYLALSRDNIHFEPTRAKKTLKIAEIRCEVFVDDLVEVFEEKDFPTFTRKIWINDEPNANKRDDITLAENWEDVQNLVFGYR